MPEFTQPIRIPGMHPLRTGLALGVLLVIVLGGCVAPPPPYRAAPDDASRASHSESYLRRFPKSRVVKGTNRKVRDDMTIQKIADLSIDSRRTDDGVGAFEVVSNRPSQTGGRDCYRLDYRYRNAIGLPKRTVEYGYPVGTWMYRFEFNAPEQHYFDAHLPEFEAMVRTIEFRVPRA